MVKWGGAALAVLMAVLWAGSFRYEAECERVQMTDDNVAVTYTIDVHSGRIGLSRSYSPVYPPLGWYTDFARGCPSARLMRLAPTRWYNDLRWVPSVRGADGPHGFEFGVTIPLWVLTFLTLLLTAAAWRLDILARRRERVGLCVKCGYSRAGLPLDTPCPECGVSPTAPAPTAPSSASS